MSIIKNPHAAVIIWNYKERFSSQPLFRIPMVPVDPQAVDTIIIQHSLYGVDISKQKSSPSGSFSITLAPTRNWVAMLTPGSWLAILMSQTPFTYADLHDKANSKQVKMLGRIESVRVSTSVNPSTGAKTTVYTVVGTDWGSVFDTVLYIDPISRGANEDNLFYLLRMAYGEYLTQAGRESYFSSDDNMRLLLMLWGLSGSQVQKMNKQPQNIVMKADISFRFPTKLVRYFGFVPSNTFSANPKSPANVNALIKAESTATPNDVALLVKPYTGKVVRHPTLTAPVNGVFADHYIETDEGWGMLGIDAIVGSHQMWQVINDNCNPILNEFICDLRWESDVPYLAFYKRFRPFAVNSIQDITASDNQLSAEGKKSLELLAARFFDVRAIKIPLREIISVEAGNNWRDKYNFIEILFDQQLNDDLRSGLMKLLSQTFDIEAFSREGFRPMMETTRYYSRTDFKTAYPTVESPSSTATPAAGEESGDNVGGVSGNTAVDPNYVGAFNIYGTLMWKHLLREWYFNTHLMLNGTINFVGQDNYIQVGDNIMFPLRALTYSENITQASAEKKTTPTINASTKEFADNSENESWVLAHVENIAHRVVISESAARSFTSSVHFIRGVIVDKDRRPLRVEGQSSYSTTGGGMLDRSVSIKSVNEWENRDNIVNSSLLNKNTTDDKK